MVELWGRDGGGEGRGRGHGWRVEMASCCV